MLGGDHHLCQESQEPGRCEVVEKKPRRADLNCMNIRFMNLSNLGSFRRIIHHFWHCFDFSLASSL